MSVESNSVRTREVRIDLTREPPVVYFDGEPTACVLDVSSGTRFFMKQDCGSKPGRLGRFEGYPQEMPT
ncbi:MAG TPA: hypothetical protein VGF95_14280 [Solirubrobacteraceae bacterium]|jgi:hypothetical protein